jgi:hypothetical protein
MSLLTTHQFIKVIDQPQYDPGKYECREAAQKLERAIQDKKTAAIMAGWPPMEHGVTTAPLRLPTQYNGRPLAFFHDKYVWEQEGIKGGFDNINQQIQQEKTQ